MHPTTPSVYIIILNWNGLSDTLECLYSIHRSTYLNYKIVIVDNGSTDGSVSTIKKLFPDISLIENPRNMGFTGGNNIGIRFAMENGAQYVWLLNNDTVIEPGTLAGLIAKGESSNTIGLVSPVIHWYEDRDSVQFYSSYVDWEKYNIMNINEKEEDFLIVPERSVSLWGTALLIKREVLEKVGDLDEKYFAYAEDADYCMRVEKAGYGITTCPGTRIYHKNSRSTGNNYSPFQTFLRIRNQYFLWMKHLKGWDRVSFVRKYLGDVISYAGMLRAMGRTDSVDMCLNGFWWAFRQRGGPYETGMDIPNGLKKLIVVFVNWRPYFWSNFIHGNYRLLYRESKDRILKRI